MGMHVLLSVTVSWYSGLQECYSVLSKFQIHVVREEMEKVDTVRYSWQKLLALAVSACDHMN